MNEGKSTDKRVDAIARESLYGGGGDTIYKVHLASITSMCT